MEIKEIINIKEHQEILDYFATVHYIAPRHVRNLILDNKLEKELGTTRFYFAYDNGKIAGFISRSEYDITCRYLGLGPFITLIYVEEEYRNEGLSSLLINKIIEDSRADGYKKIYALSEGGKMYLNSGFTLLGIKTDEWNRPLNYYEYLIK